MLTFTDQNFEKEVLKSNLPVLVDFWATWCPPCQTLSPLIEELAKSFEGKIKIGKIDVDQNPKIVEKYNVMSIPTMIIFKGREVVKQIIGVKPKEELEKVIKEVV